MLRLAFVLACLLLTGCAPIEKVEEFHNLQFTIMSDWSLYQAEDNLVGYHPSEGGYYQIQYIEDAGIHSGYDEAVESYYEGVAATDEGIVTIMSERVDSDSGIVYDTRTGYEDQNGDHYLGLARLIFDGDDIYSVFFAVPEKTFQDNFEYYMELREGVMLID